MSLHTIEHFRRLAPAVQRELAERFGLYRTEDGERTDMANHWLLRARENGTLDALGAAVQLAPQGVQTGPAGKSGKLEMPEQLVRDAYDVIGDLMAGVGRLALSADQIARMNETCVALERMGVRKIPDRIAPGS